MYECVVEAFPKAERNEPLERYSCLGVGGPADILFKPRSLEELEKIVTVCQEHLIPFIIIGAGSNVFFADGGFRGCVIVMTDYEKNQIIFHDNGCVYASAGMRTSTFVNLCAEKNLGGAEFLASIPGTLGGAVVMNAGCKTRSDETYREIGPLVTYVDVLHGGRQTRLLKDDIHFGYRTSSLKGSLVTNVSLMLHPRDKAEILTAVQTDVQFKGTVIPWKAKTLGSVFKNPSATQTAGMLIDKAGMKGMKVGDMVVTERHANVFENRGKGTAHDMLLLIETVRSAVQEKFTISLETEIQYVGENA